MYAYVPTHTPIRIHLHTRIHVHYTSTYIHLERCSLSQYERAHLFACISIDVYVCASDINDTSAFVLICPLGSRRCKLYMSVYVRICTHTYAQTYTLAHTYTCKSFGYSRRYKSSVIYKCIDSYCFSMSSEFARVYAYMHACVLIRLCLMHIILKLCCFI
jgi:hypothetical protein